MKFDVISDTHIDFWICSSKKLKEFVEKILPKDPSNVLIIAGDIGHNNDQNIDFFKELKEYYNHIVWVEGNHDLYLVGTNKALYKNSFDRLKEFIKLSKQIPNVHYLNGTTVKIDNIVFGGSCMWNDFEYGKQVMFKTDKILLDAWQYWSDCACINQKKGHFNPLDHFKRQKKLLKKVIKKSDIIVSHFIPDWSQLVPKYRNDIYTTFFHFDGQEFLQKLNKSNKWIFGHTHYPYYYTHKNGCEMICNPFGYPIEFSREIEKKIITIDHNIDFKYEDIFKDV